MRSLIVLTLAGVAGFLTGCQFSDHYENGRPVTPLYSDDLPPRKVYPPIVLKYPDESMYFFPMFDEPPHSDLNLVAIGCTASEASLVVVARVRNQGSAIVSAVPFLGGELGAFRVGAVVTTASGASEQIYAVQQAPLTVTGTVDLALGPTSVAASEVVAIDVVVDPDRIVPDPLRDNNVLSWRGTMVAGDPNCRVAR